MSKQVGIPYQQANLQASINKYAESKENLNKDHDFGIEDQYLVQKKIPLILGLGHTSSVGNETKDLSKILYEGPFIFEQQGRGGCCGKNSWELLGRTSYLFLYETKDLSALECV